MHDPSMCVDPVRNSTFFLEKCIMLSEKLPKRYASGVVSVLEDFEDRLEHSKRQESTPRVPRNGIMSRMDVKQSQVRGLWILVAVLSCEKG
jgi:hypothetical protein